MKKHEIKLGTLVSFSYYYYPVKLEYNSLTFVTVKKANLYGAKPEETFEIFGRHDKS